MGATSRSAVADWHGPSWPGAEAEARRRGCTLVQFRAYDLLAPGLYERLGYETVGVIEGCPAGSTARWYRKDL